MPKKVSYFIIIFLIGLGLVGRFFPHLPNVTPVTAIALFSATYLGLRYSFIIFFVTMFVSDIFIGFYQWQIMVAVYSGFALASLIGLYFKKHKTFPVILGGTIMSSLLFFLITNWAVWQYGVMYTHDWSGLLESYTLAIPFLKNSLAGDLFYTGVFFGAFEAVKYFVINRRENMLYCKGN
jgi:hypothetical protein